MAKKRLFLVALYGESDFRLDTEWQAAYSPRDALAATINETLGNVAIHHTPFTEIKKFTPVVGQAKTFKAGKRMTILRTRQGLTGVVSEYPLPIEGV